MPAVITRDVPDARSTGFPKKNTSPFPRLAVFRQRLPEIRRL